MIAGKFVIHDRFMVAASAPGGLSVDDGEQVAHLDKVVEFLGFGCGQARCRLRAAGRAYALILVMNPIRTNIEPPTAADSQSCPRGGQRWHLLF